MDANTALALTIGLPMTVLAVSAGISAKYSAERERLRRGRNQIHPIAQIYRQMHGLDIKDDSEQEMESLKAEVKKLHEEIASLRDTSTQFDLSIDHHLRDLDIRVASIERSHRYQPSTNDSTESPKLPLNTGG